MTSGKRPRTAPEAEQQGYNMAVYRAVEILGGVAKAAEQIGKAESQVSRYRSGVCLTPGHIARALERATAGQVTEADVQRANKRIEAARLLERVDQLLREAV